MTKLTQHTRTLCFCSAKSAEEELGRHSQHVQGARQGSEVPPSGDSTEEGPDSGLLERLQNLVVESTEKDVQVRCIQTDQLKGSLKYSMGHLRSRQARAVLNS